MSDPTTIVKEGREAIEAKDFERAEKLFTELAQSDAALATLWLGRVYIQTDRQEKGEAMMRSLVGSENADIKKAALLELGQLKFQEGAFEDALSWFMKVYDTGARDVMKALVVCLSRMNEHKRAEEFAKEAVELGQDGASEMLADVYINQNDWPKAIVQLEKAYETSPKVAYKLGIVLMRQGRNGESVKYFREAIRQGNYSVVKNLVTTYLLNKQNQNAIIIGKMGEQMNAEGIYSFLGVAYKNIGDYEKAIKYLKLGIKHKEPLNAVYFNLAQCYLEQGDYPRALRALTQSLKQNDDGVWNARGHVYWRMGNLPMAIKCFTKSTECEPNLALLSSYSLGKLYHQSHDDVSASQYFQDAWSGGFFAGGIAMGDFAFSSRDYAQAAKWYQKALDNGCQEALFPLAHAHRLLGHFDKARECFLRCLEQGEEQARIGLALTVTAERKYEEAVSIYETCVEHKLTGAKKFYGRFLADRGDYFSAIAYLTAAWEDDKDAEVLPDLAKLYFKAQPPLHNMEKVKEYTELAEPKEHK